MNAIYEILNSGHACSACATFDTQVEMAEQS